MFQPRFAEMYLGVDYAEQESEPGGVDFAGVEVLAVGGFSGQGFPYLDNGLVVGAQLPGQKLTVRQQNSGVTNQ